MSETWRLELTNQQRDLLLQGLRFVRSSVTLDPRDLDDDDQKARAERLRGIAELAERLNSAAAAGESTEGS